MSSSLVAPTRMATDGEGMSEHDAAVAASLQAVLAQFTQLASARLGRIEGMMADISRAVEAHRHALPTPSPSPSPALALPLPLPLPPAPAASSQPPALALEVGEMAAQWFAKRPFPSFEVRVVAVAADGATRHAYPHTHGWEVGLRLVSGHDLDVGHLLSGSTLRFPVVEGRAVVEGLRFNAVSSRNGGHFRLEFSVHNHSHNHANNHANNHNQADLAPGVAPAVSPDLRILSERLQNDQKPSSLLHMRPGDPLSRAPGIGKKYAKKLAALGLATVRDLAGVDSSPSSRDQRLDLLRAVRRERGALTEAKLADMLRDAKTVVRNHGDGNRDDGSCAGSHAMAAAMAAAAAAAAAVCVPAPSPVPSPATTAIKRKLEALSQPSPPSPLSSPPSPLSSPSLSSPLCSSPSLSCVPPVFGVCDELEEEEEEGPCAKRAKLVPSPLHPPQPQPVAVGKGLDLGVDVGVAGDENGEGDGLSWDAMINADAFFDDHFLPSPQ